MKTKRLQIIFLMSLFIIPLLIQNGKPISNLSSDDGKKKTDIYLKAVSALKSKDTTKAELLFKESIRNYGDAASHFELARIYLNKKTYTSRNLAYENFRKAVLKEPDNIEYRFAFANLMKDFARVSSIGEFKKILAMDSTQVKAWLSLGELKAEDFSEYNLSVRAMDEIYGSLQEFADEDFKESETYFKNALVYDSLNRNAALKLSLLYEEASLHEKGISLLTRLINHGRADKEIHLCLGLLYYKTSKFPESHSHYKTALAMMNDEEKYDFTTASVQMMFQPAYEDVVKNLSGNGLHNFIEAYWQAADPLYLTDLNERLLEHYSRVAYANLHFSVPSMGIAGWKSNRGEVVVRYGEPLNRMRIRPSMGDTRVNMKTDVWNYENMTLAFTDMALSGNFLFASPPAEKDKVQPQFGGDTYSYMQTLRRLWPIYYKPKFEGTELKLVYDIVQFKNPEKRNHADVVLSYELPAEDSLFPDGIDSINYKYGFFFMDKDYDEQLRKTGVEKINKSYGNTTAIKNFTITSRADSGHTSFEIIREKDKAAYSNRKKTTIRKFSNLKLDMSDVILAADVKTGTPSENYFTRKEINILPDPSKKFSKNKPLFIYYEVYNLKKGADSLTNFEQRINIAEYKEEKKGIEVAVSSVIDFFSPKGEEGITLTSNYQTLETDPQIFLQLDLSKYPANKYLVTVTVKDKLENREVKSSAIVDWKN
ncbi:MAG: GWxTD domain-containing protein [Ignavibacteriales bacterium]|nr:GWxTD domain-containing protein [Ignavibacteriales bacterium]